MTKTYEELLGGFPEDHGFERFEEGDYVGKIFEGLLDDAENVKLDEMDVRLGDLHVSLREDNTPVINCYNKQFLFSPWALTQLTSNMKMSAAGYFKKCIQNNMAELIPHNLNKWLEKNSNKEVVFRYHTEQNGNDRLRAVVSDRYGFFDHYHVMDSIHDLYEQGLFDGLNVDASYINPDNMSLRIIDPHKVIVSGVGNDDGSTIGMNIRNGQTGQNSVMVEFMVYTMICTNGLFIGKDRSRIYYQKHFNVSTEDFKEQFARSVERFPDYIAAVKEPIEKSRQLSLSRLFQSEDDIIDFVKLHTKLTKEDISQISNIHAQDWDDSLWGLSGAVTQFAQTKSAEHQYQLEQSAGDIINHGLRLVA